MRLGRIIVRRIRSLLNKPRAEAELQQEIDLHIEQLVNEYVAEGIAESEARTLARRQFGPVELTREQCRDMRRVNLLEDVAKDLVYALRLVRKSPGYALTAMLTLGVGIGANTAVFSAIYSVLLQPLPFKAPNRLVLITEYSPGNVAKTGSPLLRYRERAAHNSAFEQTAAYWNVSGGNGLVFGSNRSTERLEFSIVTNSFFSILGIQPAIGRAFSQSEEGPGGAKVFLASDAIWHRLLGGDAAAVGKTFRLDGEIYTLIGILPPDFSFPGACDIWIPTGAMASSLEDRVSHQFWILGRLRPDVSIARAQGELDSIQQRLAQAYPTTDANWRVEVRPLLEEFVGNARTSLWVLFGAVGFLLLIACTNVINLLMARSSVREKEFAVRAALGAARRRLLRQALTETLLIVTGGGILALILAKAGLGVLVRLNAGSIPRFEQPQLSPTVLAFSAGLALMTTLLVGVIPGFRMSGLSLSGSLHGGQRGGLASRHSNRLQNFLVITEIALTVLLLSGAGLMLRSFEQLREVDPGFRPDHLTSVRIALPDALYPKIQQRAAFLRQLLQRLNSTPGIQIAAAADRLPLAGESNWGRINIAGRPWLNPTRAPSVEGREVSTNYFRAMGIPLLRGRDFSDQDVVEGRHVTVINQEMAHQFWPGADPIGQKIAGAYRPTDRSEVIGVVGNTKDFALDEQSPAEMYSPYSWWNSMNVVVRGTDSASMVSVVRRQVAALDKEVPVYDVTRLDDLISRSVGRQRFELFLLGLFALIALVLSAIGIYGLLAFVVSHRTHEIGLRIALGAHPRGVLALVMTQGMGLVLLGLTIGIAASFVLTRLMSGLLYGVRPADPLTLGAVTLVLAAVGALACWIPSHRAMSVDPMVALRSE